MPEELIVNDRVAAEIAPILNAAMQISYELQSIGRSLHALAAMNANAKPEEASGLSSAVDLGALFQMLGDKTTEKSVELERLLLAAETAGQRHRNCPI